ncbi:MAG TPA: DUF1127 domain-containing protein [Xanthobacteraceae bacterium]|nr:DUF1127 domain-containing protein [Xanthobacteraceae bacterium]
MGFSRFMERADDPKENIPNILTRLARLLALWAARSSQRRALAELDPDRLEDVGIDRAARERECRKRFWEK